jgi:hypothetical protein
MTPAVAPARALYRGADQRRIDGDRGEHANLSGLAGAGERRIDGEHANLSGLAGAGARRIDGAPGEHANLSGLAGAGERRIEGKASAVRRSARALHAVCADLLPGYAAASREPWRQALLTAGCLDGRPVRPGTRQASPPLIVEDVVQPSDVLCALWLARRSGLFSPGSWCGDGVGRRSVCEIVAEFADDVSERSRGEVLAVLGANTAWRAHRAARMAA